MAFAGLDAKSKLEDIVQDFIQLSKEAEKNGPRESKAALTIQCAWRRKLVEFRLKRWNKAAIDIQKVFRGHVGRSWFAYNKVEAAKIKRWEFFHSKATTIQRIYRGFRSRKYVHSYYATRRFICQSLQAGIAVKKKMESYNLSLRISQQELVKKAVEEDVKNYWRSNSHLLSTENAHGVFYSPYLAATKGVNDIESRIIFTQKLERPTERKPKKRPPTWAMKPSEFITSEGPFPLTKYDQRKHAEKMSGLLDIGDKRWTNSTHVTFNRLDASNLTSIQTEYLRKFSLRKDEEKRMKSLYLKVAQKPFFIAQPKNRAFSTGPIPPLGS